MPNFRFDWSFGNTKLKKEGTVAFNIPALKSAQGFTTCPNAGICASLCYAQQGRYKISSVANLRERNILKLLGMTDPANNDYSGWGWVEVEAELIMDLELMPKRIKQVRIHDSGDFFNEAYFYTWCRVANSFPNLIFYTYTKQITLFQSFLRDGKIPTNLYIAQSAGGKEDDCIDPLLPHSRIFPSIDDLNHAGYVDCTHSDVPVYNGTHLIGLVYHGQRNLTSAQSDKLLNINIEGIVTND